jgi:hypothetical protein
VRRQRSKALASINRHDTRNGVVIEAHKHVAFPHAFEKENRNTMADSGVHSEIGTPRKVMAHPPGLALTRLPPANREELLFDDVVWVKQARVPTMSLRYAAGHVWKLQISKLSPKFSLAHTDVARMSHRDTPAPAQGGI